MNIVPIIAQHYENMHHMRVLRKRLRDRQNPFDIPENRFIEMYRLPIQLALNFIEELREAGNIEDTQQKIPLHLEMLAVLNFLASGSYQRRIASDALAFMSQAKISNCVRKYTKLITEKLSGKYIRFPQTAEEIYATKSSFFLKFGFPHILGVIDGTHIALTGMRKEIEHAYVNRKGYHSINTQLICDNDLKITNVNARYSGSTHDSYIWACSQPFAFLQLRYEAGERREWLLGDSGYPLQPFLLNSIKNARSRGEKHYNKQHCKIRSIIERCNGLLKNRFRCISGERKLRYEPRIAANIIIACAVLHNILIINNVPYEEELTATIEDGNMTNARNEHTSSLFAAGQENRNWVVNQLSSAP